MGSAGQPGPPGKSPHVAAGRSAEPAGESKWSYPGATICFSTLISHSSDWQLAMTTEEGPQRTKKRTVNSCLRCRRIKLKCDHGTPCNSCARSGVTGECIYQDPCASHTDKRELTLQRRECDRKRSRGTPETPGCSGLQALSSSEAEVRQGQALQVMPAVGRRLLVRTVSHHL